MTPLSVTILRQLADGVTVEELAEIHGVQLRTARTWRRNAISELRVRMRSAA
jgi:DNA-binding CsgD family transcriptional regulator